MNDSINNNANNNLDNSDRAGEASNTDNRSDIVNEIDSGDSIRPETLRVAPDGCNVFYGTYIDNYKNGIRSRYYYDSYGQLILTSRQTGNRPSQTVCIENTNELRSYNADIAAIAIWVIIAAVMAKIVSIVVGRFIK